MISPVTVPGSTDSMSVGNGVMEGSEMITSLSDASGLNGGEMSV